MVGQAVDTTGSAENLQQPAQLSPSMLILQPVTRSSKTLSDPCESAEQASASHLARGFSPSTLIGGAEIAMSQGTG